MEDKLYRISDYFEDDFEDRAVYENCNGIEYDCILDIVDQIFSSPNWRRSIYYDFCTTFQPFQQEKNGMNISQKPLAINEKFCKIIKQILLNFGVSSVSYFYHESKNTKRSDEYHDYLFQIEIDSSDVAKVLKNYYDFLQTFEYNIKTKDGIYPYDNDLNKLANDILASFFEKYPQPDYIKSYYDVYDIQNPQKISNGHLKFHLSDEEFNLLFKILKDKLYSISNGEIMLLKTKPDNFSIVCSSQKFYDFKNIYEEQKLSHVLKK